jgi:hypothetical protein
MAGTGLNFEAHACFKCGLHCHNFCHRFLLYSTIRIFVIHYIL